MPRQVVLKDSVQTVESYPMVRPAEMHRLRQAAAARCRVRFPGEVETAFAACEVDLMRAEVSTASVEGATTLTVKPNRDIKAGRRYVLQLPTGECTVVRAAADAIATGVDGASYTLFLVFATTGADVHGTHFNVTDGLGQQASFEWRTSGTASQGRTTVTVASGATAQECVQAMADAIAASVLRITPGAVTRFDAGGPEDQYRSVLVQDDLGPAGNTVVNGPISADAFTGGDANAVTLYLMSPLVNDVPIGSELRGFQVSRALTALETADAGRGVIDWRILDGSNAVLAEWVESFTVAHRVPRWELDDDELQRRMPEVLALRDQNDVTLEETREAALEEELLPRLRAKRDQNGNAIREERIESTWALVPAYVAAVRLHLANNDSSSTAERRAELRAELDAKVTLAMSDIDAWYTVPEIENPSPADAGSSDFASLRWGR